MPPVRPTRHRFNRAAGPAVKLELVRARDRVTWQEYFAVCTSYPGMSRPAPDMRQLLAERVDVMSGPFVDTVTHPSDAESGLAWIRGVPELLTMVLVHGQDNTALWTALMTRATPEGRRRLVVAHGQTLYDHIVERYGRIWGPETMAMLPPLYTDIPGLDRDTATAIVQLFEDRVAGTPDTAAFGDLWVHALVTLAPRYGPTVRPCSLEERAAWFNAAPHRLTDRALARLLEADTPWVRAWALTDLVRDHRRSAPSAIPPAPRVGPARAPSHPG